MIKADKYYIQNLNDVLNTKNKDENPRPKYKDGTPAHSYFITQVFETYDIDKREFPITTLRNTAVKTGIKEMFWIYQDQNSNLETAREREINWWGEWDIGNGSIGQRYGATVGKWDLMNKLLYNLEHDPFSRRHIINLLQESDLQETKGLYPCAYETLWSVRKVNGEMYLDLTLIQRSSDYIVANFINKSQYVALQMMVAGHLGYKLGKFCHMVQNLHIYDRHMDAARELISKTPILINPEIILKENKNFYDYLISDFEIKNVENISKIKSPLELGI